MAQIKSQRLWLGGLLIDDDWLLMIKICDNPINNYICGNLWIKRAGGGEMLKASGGKVKCLGKGEKSWGNIWWNEK